jgi:excisionase family DNA binding protein
MVKTDRDILTTTEAAKLLGVSVRTAQLLIEGGTVRSWKTPGGHRRVYRADIEALKEEPAIDPNPPSANVTGGPDRVTYLDDPGHAAAAVRSRAADNREVIVPYAGVAFPVAPNESQRLAALERSGLLDTPPEEAFDRLTWLAAKTLEAPISLMAMLTPTRQWFKSRLGLDLVETPRSWAFCNHTILQQGVFWVEDLSADPRFAANPAVAGDEGFRFYAGASILDREGFAMGTLCVIDNRPRSLNEREARTLSALAALGSTEVRLRGAERQLREAFRRD